MNNYGIRTIDEKSGFGAEETHRFCRLILEMHHFAKTGSGQTWGKHPKRETCVYYRRCLELERSDVAGGQHDQRERQDDYADRIVPVVRKTCFFRCNFILKTIFLPRQARDQHRKIEDKRVSAGELMS
jgi:hypothetical protein